jgi:hypothetical protein
MASSVKRCIRVLTAAVALAVPSLLFASSDPMAASNMYSLSTVSDASAPVNLSLLTDPAMPDSPAKEVTPGEAKKTGEEATPAAVVETAPEKPNIHGFFNSPFKTAYVTPRGLVVQNAGLVWQPVVGLVFPIGDVGVFKGLTFVGGIWNSVDTAEAGSIDVGAWDEMDVFVALSANVTKEISLALTYSPWNFPQHAASTEHNIDLKVSYDDSAWAMYGSSGFSLHPYVDFFFAMGNASTVIQGNTGGSGYVELGLVPTYTLKSIPNYPITLTMPTYFSVGPRTYWAVAGLPGGNVGLISTALNGSIPLPFIPSRYGFWHADAGVTYDYLVNTTLRNSGTIASGNTDHNVVIGSLGFGVNF